jgi:hypothetical protein
VAQSNRPESGPLFSRFFANASGRQREAAEPRASPGPGLALLAPTAERALGDKLNRGGQHDTMSADIEKSAVIVRATLEHYSKLRDDRVKTILTLQTLMFTALGFIWAKSPPVSLIMVCVGLVATFALGDFLRECDRLSRQMLTWWNAQEKPSTFGPPVELSSRFALTHHLAWCRSIALLEFAIGVAWGGLLVLALRRLL